MIDKKYDIYIFENKNIIFFETNISYLRLVDIMLEYKGNRLKIYQTGPFILN